MLQWEGVRRQPQEKMRPQRGVKVERMVARERRVKGRRRFTINAALGLRGPA
jgi:hypothetical protein